MLLSLLWAFLACVLSRFSRVRLYNPMDCSPPGSTIHGILQGRILEWVAMPSSRGSSRPRDWTLVSCIADRFFTAKRLGKLLRSFSVWNAWFEVAFQPKLSTLHEVMCVRVFSALSLHCWTRRPWREWQGGTESMLRAVLVEAGPSQRTPVHWGWIVRGLWGLAAWVWTQVSPLAKQMALAKFRNFCKSQVPDLYNEESSSAFTSMWRVNESRCVKHLEHAYICRCVLLDKCLPF